MRAAANLGLGNVDEALNDYNQAAVIETQSAIALVGRGACYRAQRKYEKAITDFTNAIALISNPSNLSNAQRGDDDDRIFFAAVRKSLTWPFPDLKTALYALRGTCYFYLKDYDKALADFNTCITDHPNLGQAYHARGLTYMDMSQKDKAEADFAKAIQLDDKSAKFYEARGKLYEGYGNHDKALADLNRAIALDSQCGSCFWNRGAVYEAMGDANSASRDLQRGSALGHKPVPEKQRAKIIVHMRSVQMAAEAYAVNHEGRYPMDIDESFKDVLRSGAGDSKSTWPRVNPITYRAEMPILGGVRSAQAARAAQPSRVPPGAVEYSPMGTGENYAIRGGDQRGIALPGEGGAGGTMVLSSDN
jgi:tetratricopeptide (TPR) repeat protein